MVCCISNVKKQYIVAFSSCSIPEMLRLLNLDDHLFPYSNSKKYCTKIKFMKALEKCNEWISTNMKVEMSPRSFLLNDLELDREVQLSNYLKESKSVRTIVNSHSNSEIYLCRQFVFKLSSEILHFKNIKIIQICCNYIKEIPREIGCLTNLKVLILNKNRISRLPKEIGNCKELIEINVSENRIEEIPLEISSLKKLEILNLEGNRIKNLPQFLGKLEGLKQLNVSNNPLSEIPVEVVNLPMLVELNISKCRFKEKRILNNKIMKLKEICCKSIISNNLLLNKKNETKNNYEYNLLPHIRKYILSVKECSFCGGPFFNNYVSITTNLYLFDSELTVAHKMCKLHFNSNQERIENMFGKREMSTPYKRLKNGEKDIGEMFNRYLYGKKRKKVNVPLYYLAME